MTFARPFAGWWVVAGAFLRFLPIRQLLADFLQLLFEFLHSRIFFPHLLLLILLLYE